MLVFCRTNTDQSLRTSFFFFGVVSFAFLSRSHSFFDRLEEEKKWFAFAAVKFLIVFFLRRIYDDSSSSGTLRDTRFPLKLGADFLRDFLMMLSSLLPAIKRLLLFTNFISIEATQDSLEQLLEKLPESSLLELFWSNQSNNLATLWKTRKTRFSED